MKKTAIVSVSLLCSLALLAPACAAPDPASYVVPVKETVSGKSYEALAAAWWQWARGIPDDKSPLLDKPCDVGQSGPVFFLAGTLGANATRSCTVPRDKALFFPLLNGIVQSCPEKIDAMYTCEMAKAEQTVHDRVKALLESGKVTLTLEIDGVAIEGLTGYRAHSATFNDTAPPGPTMTWGDCSGPIRDNTCGVAVGAPRVAAADGYWMMLEPLPAGEHKIHFTANIAFTEGGSFGLEVTYNLTVSP